MVLVVAAEIRELSGILARCRNVERERRAVRFARRAELSGAPIIAVANGPGPKRAARAVEEFADVQLDAVVSTGLCGALDPALRVYDIFVASRVRDLDRGEEFPARQPFTTRRHATGALASADRFFGDPAGKAELFRQGFSAVEMEAAGAARAARARGVPFYAIRAVSDTATDDFDIDFNALRNAGGGFSRTRIALAALARPWRRLPEVVRMAHRARGAAEVLGEFLAGCRF